MSDIPATNLSYPSPTKPGEPLFPPVRKKRSHKAAVWDDRPEIWFILAGLAAIVLAGGGMPVWARAGVLLVAGYGLLRHPPTETPSRVFEIALFVLIATALVSFVPASWLGRVDWRLDAAAFGVELPNTNAPSPWLAGEAFAQMLAGLGILYLWWNLRLDHESRKHALWGTLGVTSALGVGEIIGRLLHLKYPLAPSAMIFSYFPNRNQTGFWFCVGTVIAFGLMLEGMRRRHRWRGGAAGGMMLPCLFALVLSRSRMALALCALGCILVVVIRFGRDAGNYFLRVLIPLGVFTLALLVFFERDTIDRFHVQLLGGTGAESEFRLEIWRDTLGLARAQPFGVGLDQFADVYPQYLQHAMTFQDILHPDSDWFWLLAEMGWIGLGAGLVAVGALVRVFIRGAGDNVSGQYRQIAALCAGLFVLHCLVDVPTHRFGTWLLEAWLLALAAPEREPVPTWVPRALFRATGLVLILIGGLWLAGVAGLPTNTTLIDDHARDDSDAAVGRGDDTAAIADAESVINVRPMRWWPYYQRGRAELTLLDDRRDAQDDFRRAMFLQPNWARLPFQVGLLWMPYDPELAYAAWRESLQRPDSSADGLWRDICEYLRPLPQGQAYMSNLSKTNPLFRYEYLAGLPARLFPAEWADELGRDPDLKHYNLPQRQALLERWAGFDGNAALEYLRGHHTAAAEPWLVRIRALAQVGRFDDALAVARDNLPALAVPAFPGMDDYDLPSLQISFRLHPRDISVGTTLFSMQLNGNDTAGALATLGQLADMNPPPPFVWWWRAELLSRQGQAEEAWDALQPYLDYHRQVSAAPAPVITTIESSNGFLAPMIVLRRH
jgi:tetratricopeptide (TPR) repeat protein